MTVAWSTSTTVTRPLASGLRVDRMRKANRARRPMPRGWITVPQDWTLDDAERFFASALSWPTGMLPQPPAPRRTRWWRRAR